MSPASNAIFSEMSVWAVAGNLISTATVLDAAVSNTFTTNAATQSSSPLSTTYRDDLLVTAVQCETGQQQEFWNSITPGWTQPLEWRSLNFDSYTGEYKTVSSAGTYTAVWIQQTQTCIFSGGPYGSITFAAFKAADGASVRHRA